MGQQISLKQAASLQTLIRQAMALLDLGVIKSVSIHEPSPMLAIEGLRARFERALQRRDGLQRALYAIRKAVGQANAQAGVDDLLADIAQLSADLDFITAFVQSQPLESEDILLGRIERRKAPTQGYGADSSSDAIFASLLSADQIEAFRRQSVELRRRRQQLQDRVGELNVTTKISIDADHVATLKEEGIL